MNKEKVKLHEGVHGFAADISADKREFLQDIWKWLCILVNSLWAEMLKYFGQNNNNMKWGTKKSSQHKEIYCSLANMVYSYE